MSKMFNRARMTITSTGTGALTLGVAVTGYQTFSSAGVSNGDTVSYTIEDGVNWECGTGVFTLSGTTLSRTVTQSYNGSTYGTSPISVTTSAQVFITALAADLQSGTAAGNLVALDGSAKLPAVDGSQLTNVPVTATNFTGTLPVSKGGTGLTSLTAGYIPFGAGTSAFGNSVNLVWDNTNNALGIGTNAPNTYGAKLMVVSSASSQSSLMIFNPGVGSGQIGFAAANSNLKIYNTYSTGTLSGGTGIDIASDGSVGIGTTSPSGKFTVSGGRSHFVANSEIYAISVGYASIGAYYLGANSANNSLLISNSGGTTVATFDNVGNLGLGVTPSAWATYSGVLEFAGGSNIEGYSTGFLGLGSNHYYNGTNFIYKIASYANRFSMDNTGAFKWYTAPSGTAGGTITFTQAMTLDASGNLGIGTNPVAPLTVQANPGANVLYGIGRSSGGYCGLNFYNNANSVQNGYINFGDSDAEYRVRSYLQFTVASGATNAMRIDSSGNLLVGTTSPDAKGYIYQSANSAGLIVRNQNASNTANVLNVSGDRNTTNNSYYFISCDIVGVAYKFRVADSGQITSQGSYDNTTASAANLFVTSGGLFQRSTSSLRYKTNIQNATHGLSDVMNLRSVTYKGKNDGDKIFGGLIAEEVDAAGLTEFVVYDSEGQPDALHYGNMAGLFVKAIQELAAKVQALEAKVA